MRRRFHGTMNACGVGLDTARQPCNNSKCQLCSILALGFRASSYGSYGAGVYTSSAPAKADSFVPGNGCVKSMFMVLAAAGVVSFDKTSAGVTRDENGVQIDSYVHESHTADELVCYDERACLPRYLIVYSNDRINISRHYRALL